MANLLQWANYMEKRAEGLQGEVYSGADKTYPNRARSNVAGGVLGALAGGIGGLGLGGILTAQADDPGMGNLVLAGLLGLGGAGLGGWGGVKLSDAISDWRQETAVKDEIEREKLRRQLRKEQGIE